MRRHPRVSIGIGVCVVVLGGGGLWWGLGSGRLNARVHNSSDAAMVLAGVPAPRPTRVVSFEQGCMTSRCHADLKSSPTVHAPIAQGQCNGCHASDTGGHVYPLVRAKRELCTSCHETGLHEPFQHKAMGDDGCLSCHTPHGGRTAGLLIAKTEAETCVRCHARTAGSVQHMPYSSQRCGECHEPHGASNSHLLRGGAGEEHCRICHQEIVAKTAGGPHEKLDGRCVSCHLPHAGESKSLLRAEKVAGCTSCHPKVGRAIEKGSVTHDPVLQGEQCTTCHDPHGSRNAKMLRQDETKLCLSCHDKAMDAKGGRRVADMASVLNKASMVHGAITVGECTACHGVHGGEHERLLREGAANVIMGGYDVRNYALCFSCHDPDLAEPGGVTAFRDGRTNLHSTHLKNGGRGRSCAACHSVHASDAPRLIAKNVNYEGSTWSMAMGFSLTTDGGRCASACHEAMSYSRAPGGARSGYGGGAP